MSEEEDVYSDDEEFMDGSDENYDSDEDKEADGEEEADDDDTTCVMNLTSNKKLNNDVLEINEILKSQKYDSKPVMTKYEFTKILGLRSQQICEGALPLVEVPEGMTDSTEIALLELREKKIPFLIKREFSNNYREYWRVKDLQVKM